MPLLGVTVFSGALVAFVKLKGLTVPPVPVVMPQLPVMAPIETVVDVMVEGLADDVDRMTMVSPAATLATGPATNAAPLMDMPVQPALQVTVEPARPLVTTKGLLVMAVERGALVTGVKVKPNGVPLVVTCQVPLVVAPTVTVAVVAVDSELEDVCSMAMVSPLLKPVTGPAANAPPLREMAMQPALQVAV
jgi:hypothetical protein